MKVLDKFWASSTHNKIAVGLVVLGTFIGALILTVHYQGIDGRGGQMGMELSELWVGTLFFYFGAVVVKLDERRLRRQARKGGKP